MKQFCDYHPTRTAHWACPKCNATFCPECVVKRDKGEYSQGEYLHFCPKCNAPTEFCGVENIIDPFWKRLPKIFAYPFSSFHPIILILVIGMVTSLFQGPGLLGMLVRGVLFLVVLKYSFETLKVTAGGDLRPPKISSKTVLDDIFPVVKQFVLYFLIFAASGGLAVAISPIIAVLFFLVIMFLKKQPSYQGLSTALLRLSTKFKMEGDLVKHKTYLNIILSDYSNTVEAELAKAELDKFSCP